jgi:ATP-dependent Clp protease ATP-binding subunit ClpC
MQFSLKKARIYKAVVFFKFLNPHFLRFAFVILLTAGFVALGTVFLGTGVSFSVFGQMQSFGPYVQLEADFFLGLVYIFFPTALTIWFLDLFYKSYLRHPKIKENEENAAEYLDFAAAQIFDQAFSISKKAGEGELSTDSVLLAAVAHPGGKRLMYRLGIDPKTLVQNFTKLSNSRASAAGELSQDVIKLLQNADALRREQRGMRINVGKIFVALYDTNAEFQRILAQHNVRKDGLKIVALWHERTYAARQRRRKFWELENLLRKRSIGAEWVYGFPTLLSAYSFDVTRYFREGYGEIELVGRERIIQQLEQGLQRADMRNVLLVGEAGVGKSSVVYGFVQRVAFNQAPKGLRSKKVLRLDLSAVTSAVEGRAGAILGEILKEAAGAGNIILFIKRIHNFVGAQTGAGKLDVAEILLPYLQSSDLQVIATTDPVGYHKFLAPRADIAGAFSRINIEEPERDNMLAILQDAASGHETKERLFFTYPAIEAVYEDARRYIPSPAFPQKALTLLSDVVAYVKNSKKRIVEAQDVHNVVTSKTEIPLGEMAEGEKQRLINLDSVMHQEIIGQDAAVKAVVAAMQRLRAGLAKEGKPAGVFLFAGPTGVGKTLTAQVLARMYFGSEDKMLRFDMSEYQTSESMDRILGSLRTEEPGQLASAVRDNPFSVILLDEFEKAHKDLLNVFLRIFDEGKMTDVFGRVVNFENNIIIATSNAGAEEIHNFVKQNLNLIKQKERLIELFISQGYFKPELLNRFDEIVFYHPLSHVHIKKIAELLLDKLARRLFAKGYYFKITPEVIDYITNVGFDPQFGARPMNRAIADKLESHIAKLILENKIQKGQQFEILPAEIE